MKHCRNNLPGNTEFVIQPPALIVPAALSQLFPVMIDLSL
jgi:hypothetical protein